MRIGVISDTHIPKNTDKIPEIVFKHFKDVDLILHAGDLTNINVIDELRQITPNVEAVTGNMDLSENQSVLPRKKLINADGLKICLIHGWGDPAGIKNRILMEVKDDKPDIIIFGHTHQPEKGVLNNILFLNPGSPTDKVYASVNSVALLTIDKGKADAEIIVIN